MIKTFFQWLDARTGVISGLTHLCGWTVPGGRGPMRWIPPMIAFAFLLQVMTGIFLWAFYCSDRGAAWESIYYVQFILPGGWLVRGIHHFSAQLLVLLLGVHFTLLVVQGKYRAPREFVFWGTLILLLFALASCLTGDLLTWTLNGYSSTRVRAKFLEMIPVIGSDLFKIVAGGPEFGTLTIPRFLVLHVLLFGFGGFAAMIAWCWCEYRAGLLELSNDADPDDTGTKEASPHQATPQTARRTIPKPVSFWSNPVVRCALASLLFMGATLLLVYQKPLLVKINPEWGDSASGNVGLNLPRNASLGAPLLSPADPPAFYDAARPEWAFRALYHFSNYFAAEKKFYAIFVIPSCLFLYLFLIPIIGRVRIGHYLNIMVVWFLLISFCYLTYASYHHDYWDTSEAAVEYRLAEAKAELASRRVVELCSGPNRIPPGGAVALLHDDPLLQGPLLYEQHCLSCHPFQPLEGTEAIPDFPAIAAKSGTPSAPNLYYPVSADWIGGWLDDKRIKSDDYYGRTKFRSGTMSSYLTGAFRDNQELMDEPEKEMERLVDMLLAEARLDGPRPSEHGLDEEQLTRIADFGCLDCHPFYDPAVKPTTPSLDLRGYMSRRWMIDFIANPGDDRFYGPDRGDKGGNDRMMAYHLSEKDAVISLREIGLIVDWLRGTWYRSGSVPGEAGGQTDDASRNDSPRHAGSL